MAIPFDLIQTVLALLGGSGVFGAGTRCPAGHSRPDGDAPRGGGWLRRAGLGRRPLAGFH